MGAVEISPQALVVAATLAGLWLALALWLSVQGMRRTLAAQEITGRAERAVALIEAGPALPAVVRRDLRIEASDRLFSLLGLDRPLGTLLALAGDGAGLADEDVEQLAARVREAAATGGRFDLPLAARGTDRKLLVRGGPAPSPWRAGSVLLWFSDVTEAEAAKDAAAADAARCEEALDALSALIEAAPFPVWLRGPDLKLALVNSAYVSAVEAPSAVAVTASGAELFDEDPAATATHAAKVREGGEPVVRHLPATIAGQRRMMRVVEVPIGPAGVAGYSFDVEDREEARAALERFANAQRGMLDRLSAGVAQFAADRSLVFFNQPFGRLFELRSAFLADQPEFERVIDAMREGGKLPEVRDYPEWKRERRGWFTSGLDADEEDWLLPGGRHLRVVAQPMPDGGLLLIFEDRTEQIQLASSRDTLLRVRTATFDNLFEAVGVFASDGRLHLWNNRFREIWQLDEALLAERPRIDTLVPFIAERLKTAGRARLLRDLVRSATIERKQRSGRVVFADDRSFEFAAVPLPDGNALFTMLDVTDSRRIEAALRDRNEALEEADRLKTAFVSNISYELRTPLTSIAGFAEMLAGGYGGKLNAAAKDYVDAILQSVERLGALIDDVLDLTQQEATGSQLAKEEVDVAALCEELSESLEALAQDKRITLALEILPSAGSVVGDRRRLRKALDYVLRNALAVTPEGGEVGLHAWGSAEHVRLAISDQGGGYTADGHLTSVVRFHPAPGDNNPSALGLGMPLARQFVEAHGGKIEFRSEQGRGTIVTVQLPRSR